jgi:hypothetical protein
MQEVGVRMKKLKQVQSRSPPNVESVFCKRAFQSIPISCGGLAFDAITHLGEILYGDAKKRSISFDLARSEQFQMATGLRIRQATRGGHEVHRECRMFIALWKSKADTHWQELGPFRGSDEAARQVSRLLTRGHIKEALVAEYQRGRVGRILWSQLEGPSALARLAGDARTPVIPAFTCEVSV